ncbi:hypothetical protein AB4283_16460 [Vibrio splendidus]
MHVYISIVSHGHEDLISLNDSIIEINKSSNVTFVVKDNLKSKELESYCCSNELCYIISDGVMGFGENNNFVFEYCKANGMKGDDWFITMNPDVIISSLEFDNLFLELGCLNKGIYAINLFNNKELTNDEFSLRRFPAKINLINMFIGRSVTKSYDKSRLNDKSNVDWASGAFLVFNSELYEKLKGFDASYFMYYEDVDICYRAKNEYNQSVKFLSNVRAFHEGAYKNRNILSKHFRWYLRSLLIFLSRV